MIEFTSVTKEFPDGTRAVEDFSLVIPAHKTTVFVGSSGCGKTTLLRMINRMVEPTAGEIEIDGDSILARDAVALRRSIGYVMQNSGLMPHFSVIDNVATVPVLSGVPKKQARERALDVLLEIAGGLLADLLQPDHPHAGHGGRGTAAVDAHPERIAAILADHRHVMPGAGQFAQQVQRVNAHARDGREEPARDEADPHRPRPTARRAGRPAPPGSSCRRGDSRATTRRRPAGRT